MASSNSGGRGRKSTSFMRQLVQSSSVTTRDVISSTERPRQKIRLAAVSRVTLTRNTLHAGSTRTASSSSRRHRTWLLPNYYRTAKLASFQRQLNNFGYHRVGWTPARGQAQPQGLKYHKVVGEATTRTESLLELRPLSRRKRERAPAPAPRRRNARAEPLKRARTESDANAACSSCRACGARTRSPRSASRSPREREAAAAP